MILWGDAKASPVMRDFPQSSVPLCLTSLPGVEKSRLLLIQLVIKPDFVQGGLLTVLPMIRAQSRGEPH